MEEADSLWVKRRKKHSQKLNANRVGRAMTRQGFVRSRSRGDWGYTVVMYSSEEIKARQRMKASEATVT